jgi:hypothetical protein
LWGFKSLHLIEFKEPLMSRREEEKKRRREEEEGEEGEESEEGEEGREVPHGAHIKWPQEAVGWDALAG